jgi:steroid 5-alpha reductase family enzyme
LRHPNYFGEISFWWGLWLFGVAADPGFWWTIVGPLVMTALFTFISVPMIDRRLRAKKPGYIDPMRRTPAVIPWFGKRGAPTGEGDQ